MLFRYRNCMQSILDDTVCVFFGSHASFFLCYCLVCRVCVCVCTFWWLLFSFNNRKKNTERSTCVAYMPLFYSLYANIRALRKNKMMREIHAHAHPRANIRFKVKYIHTYIRSYSHMHALNIWALLKRKLSTFHSVRECYHCCYSCCCFFNLLLFYVYTHLTGFFYRICDWNAHTHTHTRMRYCHSHSSFICIPFLLVYCDAWIEMTFVSNFKYTSSTLFIHG